MKDYTLKKADCLISISEEFGHHWETIWNHPDNAALKSAGRNPLVLRKGDVLIPPLREKDEKVPCEETHRFIRKGTPALVRIQIMRNGEPLANSPWRATIDGKNHSGATNSDGMVEIPIGNKAKSGILEVGESSGKVVYDLQLGRLDPADTVSGAQGRLNNLGYPVGKVDGKLGPNTKRAIIEFQRNQGLAETGDLDQKTISMLLELHGS